MQSLKKEDCGGEKTKKFWHLPLIFGVSLAAEILLCKYLVSRLPGQNNLPLPTNFEKTQILSKTFQSLIETNW